MEWDVENARQKRDVVEGCGVVYFVFFFFNDPSTTEIYTLSLHDALPIWYGLRVCNPPFLESFLDPLSPESHPSKPDLR